MDHVSYRARTEQPRDNRSHADIDASLRWEEFQQPVTIRNISIYGALLIGGWLPPVGKKVTLVAGGLEIEGTVIWEGPDRCGLLLSHAVDPDAFIEDARLMQDTAPIITLQRVGQNRYA
ncbi:PilZ domain-containing protein [Sphingobium amiense]|uniref:PilZ domain-containing protein n=1 Tax=Sphingobium amiense TaxID=135719 RepID=A0A494WBZ2_9SPHN|nr:PilZ domain-containing protein [Sphingobium amiense]BBD97799.1 PilZ domain-containing protein [Sphingobium amiense]